MISTSDVRLDHILGWIATTANTWLPPDADPAMNLGEAVAAAHVCWPETTRPRLAGRELLFPLAYHGKPRLTAGLFHQLVDACCEARRVGSQVLLVGLPIGRSEASGDAGQAVARIAEIFSEHGWDIQSVGDLPCLPGIGPSLSRRARLTAYTRRVVDLPDLLSAAACDAAGTDWVYLAEGIVAGRHLGKIACTSPLGRLHTAGKPFAAPPRGSKRLPAGTDQVWSAGVTLGLTHSPNVGMQERTELETQVRAKLGPIWAQLSSEKLTHHYGIRQEEPLRIVLSGQPCDKFVIPLFGAPGVSAATRSLVAAAAAIRAIELVIDDVTPRVFYQDDPTPQMRTQIEALAAEHDATATYLSNLDPAELATRLNAEFSRLTITDLLLASPTGRSNRGRGSFTGYDAVHLAIMSVACGLQPDTGLAIQSHNLAAINRIDRGASLLIRSGPPGDVAAHEIRLDATWIGGWTS